MPSKIAFDFGGKTMPKVVPIEQRSQNDAHLDLESEKAERSVSAITYPG